VPSPSFSFASPKENEAKEKATFGQLLRRPKEGSTLLGGALLGDMR
jgi:hypothetical protein